MFAMTWPGEEDGPSMPRVLTVLDRVRDGEFYPPRLGPEPLPPIEMLTPVPSLTPEQVAGLEQTIAEYEHAQWQYEKAVSWHLAEGKRLMGQLRLALALEAGIAEHDKEPAVWTAVDEVMKVNKKTFADLVNLTETYMVVSGLLRD
jgi:hypothetical protein